MSFAEQEETRAWILGALESLCRFVQTDGDFRGNKAYESKAIAYQRRFIEDGKYRVVFLGTFNVGKSTAINAFLGGSYLPMDVEECTSQLTFIERADVMALRIKLHEAAAENEIDALRRSVADASSGVVLADNRHDVEISFDKNAPAAMRRCLEPLVTVMADELYPHLAPLREKIEEITLLLPASVLEEDIAFVDTPGVHSVSETRAEITYGIIERSHLVIVFVDSSFADNIHDLNFIKRIIKWRGRRVFFVLNKADKLDADEIDPRGTRGPARSLVEAFVRHGIPEDSEIFFLSGYRALRAQELERGDISLDELLEDNRLSIPTSVVERVEQSNDAARDLAAYLLGQSRLLHLKERLLEYLSQENKAAAVLGTGARFVAERAEDFVISMENELNLAKDPAKFEDLRASRDKLMERLAEIRQQVERILARYLIRSRGGTLDGATYAGFEGKFRSMLSEQAIEELIVKPVLSWLRSGTNLKDARRQRFAPLMAQIQHHVDEFVSSIMQQLELEMSIEEDAIKEEVASLLGTVRELRAYLTRPNRQAQASGEHGLGVFDITWKTGGLGLGATGAAIGATMGAIIGTSLVPVAGTAIGAGIGGLVGAIGGLISRLTWSDERWARKLEPIIKERVQQMLLASGTGRAGEISSVAEATGDYLRRRIETFEAAVRAEAKNAIDAVQREIDDLLAREEEIRRESEAIIARLAPKVAQLHELRDRAAQIHAATPFRELVRA